MKGVKWVSSLPNRVWERGANPGDESPVYGRKPLTRQRELPPSAQAGQRRAAEQQHRARGLASRDGNAAPIVCAKGAIHPSLGQRPRKPPPGRCRAESPIHPRGWSPMRRAFSPAAARMPKPGAMPQAGMRRAVGPPGLLSYRRRRRPSSAAPPSSSMALAGSGVGVRRRAWLWPPMVP